MQVRNKKRHWDPLLPLRSRRGYIVWHGNYSIHLIKGKKRLNHHTQFYCHTSRPCNALLQPRSQLQNPPVTALLLTCHLLPFFFFFFKTLKLSYDRFQLDKCSLIFIASHGTDLLHPCLIYLTCVGMQPRALNSPPATRHSFCSALSIYLGFHIRLLLYNKKHTHPVFYHCLLPW